MKCLLNLSKNQLSELNCDEWIVTLHSEDMNSIFSSHISEIEIKKILNQSGDFCSLSIEIPDGPNPSFGVVHPRKNGVTLLRAYDSFNPQIADDVIKNFKIIKSKYNIATNLSIIPFENGFRGVFRLCTENYSLDASKLHDYRALIDVKFDASFNIVEERKIGVSNHDSVCEFEDFRLFQFKDKIYSSVTRTDEAFNSRICILDEEHKFLGPVIIENYNRPVGRIFEKNWLFFERNEELFFIYSTMPRYIVYKCADFSSLKFEKYIDMEWPLDEYVPEEEIYPLIGGPIHVGGSTSPVFIPEKKCYLYLIHTKLPSIRKYNHYAVLLDENLMPMRLNPQPIISKNLPHPNIFVMSLISHEGKFILSGGVGDFCGFTCNLNEEQIINDASTCNRQ